MSATQSQNVSKKSKRSVSKSILVVGAAVILIAAAGFAYWSRQSNNEPQSGPTKQELEQQAQTNADDKLQAIEHPTQDQVAPPPNEANFTIVASKGPNGTETITASLGNVAEGTCKLDITNGDKHTSQTADVIYQPQSSSCAGFSVPIDQVGTGSWQITLSVTSKGVTTSKTVTETVR